MPGYSDMVSWGQPQQPISTQGGLRSWEMQQPGLVDGAGGLPYTSPMSGAPTVPAEGNGNFMGFSSPFFGSTDKNGVGTQGWGGTAINAASGLFNAFMGMKQYGLYKDQLNESKKQFGLNYDAQRQTTNASLEDRQRARVASGGAGAYQSVGDYMTAHSIAGGH